jgi:predicted metalloprotease
VAWGEWKGADWGREVVRGGNPKISGTKLICALVTVLAMLSGCDLWQEANKAKSNGQNSTQSANLPILMTNAASEADWEAAKRTPEKITYPTQGTKTWDISAGDSQVGGQAGTLLRFRVAVEKEITGVDRTLFGNQVFSTLVDPRSWTSTGKWRFQRVGDGERYDFTLYLATPATRDILCGATNDRYTSCRNGDSVVINVARWANSVPNFGASLDVYRQYVVNHEVGHRLGHGHELCTGTGNAAPVMQQQTLGLHGCTANAWPFVDNKYYSGKSGQYDDPIPAA